MALASQALLIVRREGREGEGSEYRAGGGGLGRLESLPVWRDALVAGEGPSATVEVSDCGTQSGFCFLPVF